ncbi:MAG: phosphoglucosamine mutase [Candidatus Pacebacteria bacterium]|nr:phosphoglucosamine mutase [Candidatus Paceibacterota bacterium]
MNNTLKLGISGIRGIWGESLTPENTDQLIQLFLDVIQPKRVVLGTDTRRSRDAITEVVVTSLRKRGCHIIDCGITTTPTLALMVRSESADAGIVITASHNPAEWNGLKFFTPQGLFLNPIKMNEIIDRYNLGTFSSAENKEGESMVTKIDIASEVHVQKALHHIDIEAIKNANLKVVIDMGNGAGTDIDPFFMSELGIDATYLHEKTDGEFERNPEPVVEALGALSRAVIETKANIGFAQDPDADRLVISDERGNIISEEYTLVLAMRHYLATRPDKRGLLVTNLSTSKMFDDVAAEFDCKVLRTQIGEINVASAMVEEDAVFGGEGNGGVIWPEVGYVRDSISGMALILELLATSGKTISQLAAEIPKYEIVKDKIEVSSRQEVEAYLQKTKDTFKEYPIDMTDGIKVNFENGWLHVRASNTEPIVRFFAEAPTGAQAESWIKAIKDPAPTL